MHHPASVEARPYPAYSWKIRQISTAFRCGDDIITLLLMQCTLGSSTASYSPDLKPTKNPRVPQTVHEVTDALIQMWEEVLRAASTVSTRGCSQIVGSVNS